MPSFQQLLAAERQFLSGGGRRGVDAGTKLRVQQMLRLFQFSANAQNRARGIYVNAQLFPRAAASFRKFVLRSATSELAQHLASVPGYSAAVEDLLFGYFAEFVELHYASETASIRAHVQTMDMRQPHTWYPFARALQRRVIYHAGPTNSGKTYSALQALKAAPIGVYCGPLRLLAMEIYDSLNMAGVYCNLTTGQEKRLVPGAQHTSCTVEMVNFAQRYDVAVIDEIQMLGDEQRGWAWTRALLGVPANEIHVCGDMSALRLVASMCKDTGDALEVRKYDRFSPLAVDPRGLPNGYADVRPGDCIAAFSRRNIYGIKKAVEEQTGHRVCVVYGALPPETRRHQAALFNDPDSDYKVLVASDAIGMGLNFNIRRVVFHELYKTVPGVARAPVSTSLIKQIAGRAGRRNSVFSEGVATCLRAQDVPRLTAALAVPPEALKTPAAGLFPEFEHLELLASQLPNHRFEQLFQKFAQEAQLDGTYFFCNQDSLLRIAKLLERVPNLSLADRYTFCMAPANLSDPMVEQALLEFVTVYSRGFPVGFNLERLPKEPPVNERQMLQLESMHKVVSLWLWLSLRFEEDSFPGRDKVCELSSKLIDWMNRGLHRISQLHLGVPDSGVDHAGLQAKQLHPPTPNNDAWLMEWLNLQQDYDTSIAKYIRRSGGGPLASGTMPIIRPIAPFAPVQPHLDVSEACASA